MTQRTRGLLFSGLLAILCAMTLAAHAAAPDAGSLLRQLRPDDDSLLSRPEDAPKLQIRQADRVELVDRTPFPLRQIDFAGNTRVETATLTELAGDMPGRDVTLAELDELARRIGAHYHAEGYPLARALVPAQTIENGVVRIDIYEAKLGTIRLDNESEIRSDVVLPQVSDLKPGEPVADPALERALLLVSDLPATTYEATLAPGQEVGSTDLAIRTVAGRPWDASVGVDNGGNESTGRLRVNGAGFAYNRLGRGDTLSLNAITSGANMSYLRGSVEAPLPVAGLRAGVALSGLKYSLGGDLEPLDGRGTAAQATAWLGYALNRSVRQSSYVRLQYDRVRLRDGINANNIHNDRHIDMATVELSGNLRLAQSQTWWTASASAGRLAFDDAPAKLADRASARTSGAFLAGRVEANHLRTVGRGEVLLTGRAQVAQKNLDSSQKLQLGGASLMRAYDSNTASGDAGVHASAEYRHDLASTSYGRWRWNAFAETAHVKTNVDAWATSGRNSVSLHGAGAGVSLDAKGWSARAVVASPIGHPKVAGIERAARAWVDLSYRF